MKHTQVSSRPILFSARTPQAHTPTSLHTSLPQPTTTIFHIFTPYQHHWHLSVLLLPAPSPCLSARPSVRPSVRTPRPNCNPTIQRTNKLNAKTRSGPARNQPRTLPRTSDKIASLRTKIVNAKGWGFRYRSPSPPRRRQGQAIHSSPASRGRFPYHRPGTYDTHTGHHTTTTTTPCAYAYA